MYLFFHFHEEKQQELNSVTEGLRIKYEEIFSDETIYRSSILLELSSLDNEREVKVGVSSTENAATINIKQPPLRGIFP